MIRKGVAQWRDELSPSVRGKAGSGPTAPSAPRAPGQAVSGVGPGTGAPGAPRERAEGHLSPSEQVATAHARCFSMALAMELGKVQLHPEAIRTEAQLTMANEWTVSQVRLEVEARVPGAEVTALQRAARQAQGNCPLSKLRTTEITLVARLV